ncbi:hypothetical protein JCM10213v2_001849 [Rhodosporidiobolus nylandii]
MASAHLQEQQEAREGSQTQPREEHHGQRRELGMLVVVVLKAQHLPDPHKFSKQDPFVLLNLETQTEDVRRTKADKGGGQHPLWDDEFRFRIFEPEEGQQNILHLRVMRQERKDEEELIGEAKVLADGSWTEFDEWVELKENGKYRGELYLECTFYPVEPAKPLVSDLQRRPSRLDPSTRTSRVPAGIPSDVLPTMKHLSVQDLQSAKQGPPPLPPKGAHLRPMASQPALLPLPGEPDPQQVPEALRPGRPQWQLQPQHEEGSSYRHHDQKKPEAAERLPTPGPPRQGDWQQAPFLQPSPPATTQLPSPLPSPASHPQFPPTSFPRVAEPTLTEPTFAVSSLSTPSTSPYPARSPSPASPAAMPGGLPGGFLAEMGPPVLPRSPASFSPPPVPRLPELRHPSLSSVPPHFTPSPPPRSGTSRPLPPNPVGDACPSQSPSFDRKQREAASEADQPAAPAPPAYSPPVPPRPATSHSSAGPSTTLAQIAQERRAAEMADKERARVAQEEDERRRQADLASERERQQAEEDRRLAEEKQRSCRAQEERERKQREIEEERLERIRAEQRARAERLRQEQEDARLAAQLAAEVEAAERLCERERREAESRANEELARRLMEEDQAEVARAQRERERQDEEFARRFREEERAREAVERREREQADEDFVRRMGAEEEEELARRMVEDERLARQLAEQERESRQAQAAR